MNLSDHGQALAYEAAFAFVSLDNPALPVDQFGELSLQLSAQLRALAIIELLVNASTDGFCHNLMRSGRVRLAFLSRLHRDGVLTHHHGGPGRFGPTLDLLAAGDVHAVADMARLSRSQWQQGSEYEDDFCYGQMLFRLAAGDKLDAAFLSLADRFKAARVGQQDARVDVCVALAQAQSSAFDEAFDALLNQHSKELQADEQRAETVTPEVLTGRYVYVEGIALLRLAEARGLPLQREYAFCPSLARMPMTTPLSDEDMPWATR